MYDLRVGPFLSLSWGLPYIKEGVIPIQGGSFYRGARYMGEGVACYIRRFVICRVGMRVLVTPLGMCNIYQVVLTKKFSSPFIHELREVYVKVESLLKRRCHGVLVSTQKPENVFVLANTVK